MNASLKKRFLIGGLLVVTVIGIPLSVYLFQKQQEIRSRASITSATCGTVPANIMLIIDRSGSMGERNGTASTKISAAKAAASNFVDIIAKDTRNTVGLVSFSTTSTLDSPLTTSYSTVKSKINSMYADGYTCLQCAIDAANNEINAHGQANIKKIVIILTDGLANRINGRSAYESDAQESALKSALSGRALKGTAYFTIGLGSDVDGRFLTKLAAQTGGSYFFSPTSDQLNQIYQNISILIAKGSISGMVFNDANNNAVFDSGEVGLSGWTIKLSKTGTTETQNFTTDSNGAYTIGNLCDGTYGVSENLLNGWRQTIPANGSGYSILITNEIAVADKNFGNYNVPLPTSTPIPTLTYTPTPTHTPTPTPKPSSTPIPTNTPTLKPTSTVTPTLKPSSTPKPTATITPKPSATPTLGPSSLSLIAYLHGIGHSGDNANPTQYKFGNQKPLHDTRAAEIMIYNSSNKLIASSSTTLNYSSTSGNFSGSINLTQITTNNYTVRVRINKYLVRLVPGIQNLVAGKANVLPDISMVTGDIINDNKLDILDYNRLLDCYSDLLPAVACNTQKKDETDINDDGDVDQVDYNLYLRELSTQPGE